MEEDDISRVMNLIQNTEFLAEDSRYSGIGLSNIHKRLQLLYSSNAGLYLENSAGKGLRVVIYLPYH